MAYLEGNIVRFDVSFTDPSTGDPVDPTTVTFSYQVNGGAFSSAITYTNATQSAVGVIARLSAGNYETLLNTTNLAGIITGLWVSTGTGAASAEDTITVGQATPSGLSFGDMIEVVNRRAIGPVRLRTVQVNETDGIGTDDETITFDGPQSSMVLVGSTLAIDLEELFVLSLPSSGVAAVMRGWNGSTPAEHANDAMIYIDPPISRFDVAQAINDDLNDLSGQGLYRVGTAVLTYNPVFMGYDLGALPSNYNGIIGISFREVDPSRRFPIITNWDTRNFYGNTDPDFPSGQALILYEDAYPGLPVYVTYSAPFIPLVQVSDSVINTPTANDNAPPNNGYTSATAANLALTMLDIPPLGATAALVQPKEINRDDMGTQPNPQRPIDVPAQAIATATNPMLLRRAQRISAEADRLYIKYPDRR